MNTDLTLNAINNKSSYDQANFNNKDKNNQQAKTKVTNFTKTRKGKIILGVLALSCVGSLCAIIAVPIVCLSSRSISSTNSSSNTFILSEKQPIFINASIAQPTQETKHSQLTQLLTELPHQRLTSLSTQLLIASNTQTITKARLKPTTSIYQQNNNFISSIANNLTSQVNKQNLEHHLTELLKIGMRDNDRNSADSRYFEATKYLKDTLRTMGMFTIRQGFVYGNSISDYRDELSFNSAIPKGRKNRSCKPINNASCNLCGVIPGKTNQFIVVGSHLDTVHHSPGANDNAAAVVALVEIIRIFKESKPQLNNPILFCFWGSEEVATGNSGGIGFGSGFFLHNSAYKKVVNKLLGKSESSIDDTNIKCYLNLELVGTKNRRYEEDINIEDPTHTTEYAEKDEIPPKGTQELTELYAEFLAKKNINFFRASPNPSATDVGSFYKHKIPGITITAGQDKEPSCYHKPCDNIDGIDFTVLSNITRAVIYSITKLSLAEGSENS